MRGCLSLTLCPPGLPGRRSRAAQALVAPAGAKLPRTLSLRYSLAKEHFGSPQAAVLNSCFLVRMGAIAVFLPPCGEAQTAAGVRSSRFLPKTARRAPQALEAGAFWVHWPKAC